MKCFLLEDCEDGAKQYIVLELSKKQSCMTVQIQCNHSSCPLLLFLTTTFGKNTRTTLKRQIITSYFPTSTTPLFLFLKIKISMVSCYHISKNDYQKLSQETHFCLLHHPSLLREPKASQCFPLITVHSIPDIWPTGGTSCLGGPFLQKFMKDSGY